MDKRTEWGDTVVHDDVVAAIAARAAVTVAGVVQTSQHGLSDNLSSLVRHDHGGRGVRVAQLGNGHYALDMHLVVHYGVRIPLLARQVADEVNRALFDAVGQYPDNLSIHIEGIRVLD